MHAIMRTAKLKTWGNIGGSAAHTYRVLGLAPNADPARLGLNRTVVGSKGQAVQDIRSRVDALTGKPRANAVLTVELFLGASPEWFKGKSTREVSDWVDQNVKWMKQEFGDRNVVHVVLHRDESTPHLVAYVVPEVNGTLNCRALLGGRAKLTSLQTSYAKDMARFGLQRGIEGSKAEHQPMKVIHAAVNRTAAETEQRLKQLATPIPPPDLPLLTSRKDRQKAMEEWKGQEVARTAQIVQEASSALLEASLAQDRVKHLRQENGRLSDDLAQARHQLGNSYAELGLSKEQIGALRTSDVTLVAQRLGFMGVIKPNENAIDLVRRINGFDFAQSVAWLYHELGPERAGVAVIKSLEDHQPARPLTPAENVIKRAIAQQTDALGCDRYRLTLVSADESKKPYLPGKSQGKGSVERFYSRQDLADLVPWLRTKNNLGDNVFITPMDDNAFYILLDDVKVSQKELEAKGFEPCLVQRSSWESQQVVFKVPRSLSRDVVIGVFNDLNKRIGDPEMTGLRHPFRLAGLRNMKPKHEREGQHPFVEVVLAVNRFCAACTALIQRRMKPTPALDPTPQQVGLR